MKRTVYTLLVICLLVIACTDDTSGKEVSTILYVPLDERPVNLDYAAEIINATGENLLIPPVEYLPRQKTPGHTGKLWQWVFENCPRADYIVLSADTMIYGGLTPSRIHNLDKNTLDNLLSNFDRIKELNPEVKLYVFSTIMRTHKQNTSLAEPDYYGTYGKKIYQITALRDKDEVDGLSPGEKMQLGELLEDVPKDVLNDYMNRRAKNFSVNSTLLDKTAAGVIDHFVLCRDDTSYYSQSSREFRLLSAKTYNLPAGKFTSLSGADEVGLVLLTRAVNDLNAAQPAVFVRYARGVGGMTIPKYEDYEVWKNVGDHLNAAGCVPAYSPEDADLILAVNTPVNGVTREAGTEQNAAESTWGVFSLVKEMAADIAGGKKVAVADISYANGSDNGLMAALAHGGLLNKISAYAGWNTAGNSLGYALGQGILAQYMNEKDVLNILAVRLLDDWGYQANVRGEVQREVIASSNVNKFNLGANGALVKSEVEYRLLQFAEAYLKDFNIEKLTVSFPWNRTFEINLKLSRTSN
ncbi:hypothetical protein JOC37_000065 [Desulfohalotomaculum tongense]|uniref:DUF4127 family protein n=1 Tax=Desulforadius tongensis TaxID=1216062 RepID=UPI001958109E|nr:DUF4127 family protein [Desulforadius tongensis]MBM7853700.1 hypothetical protein [Desulforadius tongensis]